MRKNSLREGYEKYVRDTPAESFVFEAKIPISKMPQNLAMMLGCRKKAFASTRAIKHLYDKRPAEEFDAVINYLPRIIETPDFVYRNKHGKRGNFCFVKNVLNVGYLASLEKVNHEMQLVTAFRVRDQSYLKEYDLLRSWRDGAHSS